MGNTTMISMMTRAAMVLIALLSLAVAAPAYAQESELAPEHLALARKYIDLTDKSGIYETALLETALQTAQTLLRQNPDLDAPVDEAIKAGLDAFKNRKGDLLDQFARVYALTFSMEELQQIVAFYESPVGSKLASANAAINPNLQNVMQVFQVNLRTEFFAKVRAELRAAGHEI